MPELPEVETCRRIVERELAGRTVVSVLVRLDKLMRSSPLPTLEPLIGSRVIGARRRAKILLMDFDNDLTLAIHLKLAGQVAVFRPDGSRHIAGHPVPSPTGPYPHKSTHVEIGFDDSTILYLSDIRQFGWLRLQPSEQVDALLSSLNLGPEANGSDGMNAKMLGQRLAKRTIPIKTVLLDQKVLAGIGNIYVDEALHHARIHPSTPANSLSRVQVERLWIGIVWALDMGVAQGGANIVHGKAHQVDGFPAVHGREGEACDVCGGVISKIRVGGRGTYLCIRCQPAPRKRRAPKPKPVKPIDETIF